MRGGPQSRSRRWFHGRGWQPGRSIWAVALSALALACGAAPAAGVRVELGGASGGGASGGATGAGSTVGTGTGGGAPGDAGTADALPPFDGGTCTDNGGGNTDPNMIATSGAFSGALAGAVCTGGAYAHVESVPAADGGAPSFKFFIGSAVAGAEAGSIRFQTPANATSGRLDIEVGIPSATPGTYALAATCGSAALTAYLPAGDPSICATDADTFDCPDGCELTGSIPQTCTPIPPQRTYAALAADDCFGDATPAAGSWTLTLTSLTADPKGVDSSGVLNYAPHGTLTATLVDEDPDAGTAGVSLSLAF
ncbi:MAG TPA: hypothetical protein VKZ18_14880 [Polyangia bacterium]|nr:hypothetical protein [Polyangia bacterium]